MDTVDTRSGGGLPRVRREPGAAERGSTLPFVLVCWTVAALMAFGAIAASDAFLEQQAVQSVCDGAEVTVRCTRYVDIAFGWLFLGGEQLERTATASARAPTAP